MVGSPKESSFQSNKSAEEIQSAYDEEEAAKYAEAHWLKRRIGGRTRRRQFGDATGRVLDVACGTGVNFPHLPESADLVGIDVSTQMLTRAREKADELGRQVELEQMDAQRLSFADDSFDHVVSSLSTCTFPDPIEALNEMGRVCKPDGQIRLQNIIDGMHLCFAESQNDYTRENTSESAADCTTIRRQWSDNRIWRSSPTDDGGFHRSLASSLVHRQEPRRRSKRTSRSRCTREMYLK